jgi:preprotein translocase subunit SecG
MHPIEGNTPALDRPTMILLVLLFVIGFLISILAPSAMYEMAMTFR